MLYSALLKLFLVAVSLKVPIAYIRPLIQKQKKEKSEQSLIKIPENLKILPTDTEEVISQYSRSPIQDADSV